jgi:hypothetical protein
MHLYHVFPLYHALALVFFSGDTRWYVRQRFDHSTVLRNDGSLVTRAFN